MLAARGIAGRWSQEQFPYSVLESECRSLRSRATFLDEFSSYLGQNPIIRQTVETLLAQLAMTANTKWQNTPSIVQPLSRRGWHIGRWLPTFLIIDGPLGRLFKDKNSPLRSVLQSNPVEFPILSQARDIFNHNSFRLIRNGVGHWAFTWEDGDSGSVIHIFEQRSPSPAMTITLMEAEAFHLVSFSTIEVLDHELLNPRT